MVLFVFSFWFLRFIAEGLSVDQVLRYFVLVCNFGPFGFLLFFVYLDLFLLPGVPVCLSFASGPLEVLGSGAPRVCLLLDVLR